MHTVQGGLLHWIHILFPNCIHRSPASLLVIIYRKVGVYSVGARPFLCLVLSALQFHCTILVIECMGSFLTRLYFYHLLLIIFVFLLFAFFSFLLLLSACYSNLDYSFFLLGRQCISFFSSFDFPWFQFPEVWSFALFVSIFGFPLYVCFYQSLHFSFSFFYCSNVLLVYAHP